MFSYIGYHITRPLAISGHYFFKMALQSRFHCSLICRIFVVRKIVVFDISEKGMFLPFPWNLKKVKKFVTDCGNMPADKMKMASVGIYGSY